MEKETEVLIKFWEEQWSQARQSEDQRSTMANFLISIFTVGIGFIINSGFALGITIPVSIFLIIIGLFGYLFSLKLFERWRLHEQRAIKWSEQIDRLNPDAKLLELFWEVHEVHKSNHPKMTKVRLYRLWGRFYLILVGLAIICSIVSIILNT